MNTIKEKFTLVLLIIFINSSGLLAQVDLQPDSSNFQGKLTVDNTFTNNGMTYPQTDGSSRQVLTTDGEGNLHWRTPGSFEGDYGYFTCSSPTEFIIDSFSSSSDSCGVLFDSGGETGAYSNNENYQFRIGHQFGIGFYTRVIVHSLQVEANRDTLWIGNNFYTGSLGTPDTIIYGETSNIDVVFHSDGINTDEGFHLSWDRYYYIGPPVPSPMAGFYFDPVKSSIGGGVEYDSAWSNCGHQAVFFGSKAKALGDKSVAIGRSSRATEENSIGLGIFNNALSPQGTAVGYLNYTFGDYGVALGSRNNAAADTSIAVGFQNLSNGFQSTSMGFDNTSNGELSSSIGALNLSEGYRSSAFGYDNQSTKTYTNAFGYKNTATALNATAIGHQCHASGKYSAAIGYYSYSTQDNSLAYGYSCISTGKGAVAFGKSITAGGMSSVAMGNRARALEEDAVAVGGECLSTGSRSIAIGLRDTASGIASIAVGYECRAVSNGSAFGYRSKSSSSGTSLGYLCLADDGGAVAVGNRDSAWGFQSVAIGHFNKSFDIRSISLGISNTSVGYESITMGMRNEATGSHSTSIGTSNVTSGDYGYSAGYDNQATGDYSHAFGHDNLSSGDNSTTIGDDLKCNSYKAIALGTNNSIMFGYSSDSWVSTDPILIVGKGNAVASNAMLIRKNGNVGIGTNTPAYDLHVGANSAAKPSSSSWTVASDVRLKTDIQPYQDGLATIKKIEPVWFRYTGEAGMPRDRAVGIIAQDLQEIAPYMVSNWNYFNPDEGADEDYLAVDNGAITYMLINAVKEQQQIIEDQRNENDKLNQMLESLLNRVEKLEEKTPFPTK